LIPHPNDKARLKHADPKDLIASVRGHQAEVIRLLGEIEALINEVQA
jgi:type I restriction enzyme M protein